MAKKEKKSGFWKEFKEFAIKGNMFDMAIGVIIGAVFKDLVTSFTDNIIMPVVNIITGNIDFSAWKIALPSLFGEKIDAATGEVIQNYMYVGNFISSVISFFILAFVIFMMVKGMNKLRERNKEEEAEAPAAPPEPSAEEVLLTEIRDILKNKK